MERLLKLADRIALKLATDGLPQDEFPAVPDKSFGVLIPGPTTAWLKKLVCKTFRLVSEDSKLGQLINQFEKALPDVRSAHTQMIKLVEDSRTLTLKGLANRANKVLGVLEKARAGVYGNTTLTQMARTVDIELHRVVTNLWKALKRIYSCPELKGTPLYTWNFGPGANPVKPVRSVPKTFDQKERQRLMNPTPDQVIGDIVNKHQEKEKRVPTFEEYEQYLDEDDHEYTRTA